MLNECKTTGWIASDFIRTMKMWLWTHRNVDAIIEITLMLIMTMMVKNAMV